MTSYASRDLPQHAQRTAELVQREIYSLCGSESSVLGTNSHNTLPEDALYNWRRGLSLRIEERRLDYSRPDAMPDGFNRNLHFEMSARLRVLPFDGRERDQFL